MFGQSSFAVLPLLPLADSFPSCSTSFLAFLSSCSHNPPSHVPPLLLPTPSAAQKTRRSRIGAQISSFRGTSIPCFLVLVSMSPLSECAEPLISLFPPPPKAAGSFEPQRNFCHHNREPPPFRGPESARPKVDCFFLFPFFNLFPQDPLSLRSGSVATLLSPVLFGQLSLVRRPATRKVLFGWVGKGLDFRCTAFRRRRLVL